MPASQDLPSELAALARRNAFRIHDDSFDQSTSRLIESLERALAEAPAASVLEGRAEITRQRTPAISDAPRQTDTMGAGIAAEEEREKAEAQRRRDEAEARRDEAREKARAGRKAKEAKEAQQTADAQKVQGEADAVATGVAASEVLSNSIIRAVALPAILAAAAWGISFFVAVNIRNSIFPDGSWWIPCLILTFIPIGGGGCWMAYRLTGRKVPGKKLVVLVGAWVISFVAFNFLTGWLELAALASMAGFFVGQVHKRIEPSLTGKHLFAIAGVWAMSWSLAGIGYTHLVWR